MISPGNLWTVARQTFSQCLRMKIALAFLLLLGGILAGLPLTVRGDGTLAGVIRTFLSYSVSAIGTLLSLVTVLAAARGITADVEERQIFLLAVKPLSRGEYILGRWLGMVLLNALLLAIAAGVVYGVSQHMRRLPATDPADRQAIEMEVFAARREVRPQPFDVEKSVADRVRELQRSGQFSRTVEEYQWRGNLSRQEAERRVLAEIRQGELAKRELAGPGEKITWEFRGLPLQEAVQTVSGTLLAEDRSRGLFRFAAPREFLGALLYDRPVRVNGVMGRVRFVSETDCDVQFDAEDRNRSELADLRLDQPVALAAEPMFQFRYSVSPADREGSTPLYRQISFLSPSGAPEQVVRGLGPVKTPVTISVPASGSLRDGEFRVEYFNPPYQPSHEPGGGTVFSPTVRVAAKDVSVLYRVGGFEGNFLQAMLLIFFQLAFLAALAVFLASFLSFPVAALSVLVLLGAGMLLEWLADAIRWGDSLVNIFGAAVVWITRILMPSLAETSPSDMLVDGLYISWTVVARTAGLTAGLRAALYLAAGCWIFHRRELARVQV